MSIAIYTKDEGGRIKLANVYKCTLEEYLESCEFTVLPRGEWTDEHLAGWPDHQVAWIHPRLGVAER